MNNKKNILIAGPILPPAGGISIHIYRLEQLLKDEFRFSFIDESSSFKKNVFNIRSLNFFRYIKLVSQSDLFFIQSGNKYFKKLHIITGKIFRKKIIVTLHGYGNERKKFFRNIDSFFFNLADNIILVNDQISGKLNLRADKCLVKHAFLPPVMNKEKPLPAHISEKIALARQQNKIIICGNASRLNTFNNQDLYGLDMCLEVSKSLSEKRIPYSFFFIVTSLEEGRDRYNDAVSFITDNHMEDVFFLLNEEISFVNLIAAADIVLRPTNTDGDALTIREALFLKKMVLASDIVSRPLGTLLFKTRDSEDLRKNLTTLIHASAKNEAGMSNSIEEAIEEDKQYYSDLFNRVMNNN